MVFSRSLLIVTLERGMRASRYNVFHEKDDESVLLFSAATRAMVRMNRRESSLVREILSCPQRTMNDPTVDEATSLLRKGRFLVEDDEDELATIKAKSRMERYTTERLELTILPGFRCNFGCAYCAQRSESSGGVSARSCPDMTETVRNRILDFLSARTECARSLSVTWAGGEPLLYREMIVSLGSEMRRICENNDCAMSSRIVTNGYLLGREEILSLKTINLKEVEVVLDGPAELHNRRRPTKEGGPTFERIVRNLRDTVDRIERMIVRVNVDDGNLDHVPAMLDLLAQEPFASRVDLFFAPTGTLVDNGRSDGTRRCGWTLSRSTLALYQEAQKRGMGITELWRAIGSTAPCMGSGSWVIDPKGRLFKCPADAGLNERALGVLTEEGETELFPSAYRWISWDIDSRETCSSCPELPVCMGGCPYDTVTKTPGQGRDEEAEKERCDSYKGYTTAILEIIG